MHRLVLEKLHIEIIHGSAFSGLSDWLTDLQLSNNALRTVPTAISTLHKLSTVNLKNNRIHTILPDDFSNLTKLIAIYLPGNVITKVGQLAFSDQVSSLSILNLNFNPISNVSLSPLHNLTALYINKCSLDSVLVSAFLGKSADSVEEVYLNDNEIESLHSSSLMHLHHLKYLVLSRNFLTSKGICYGVWKNQKLMTNLNLYQNNVSSIPKGCFQHLSSLKKLDLRANAITFLNTGAFNGLLALEKLDIARNRLKNIENGAFDDLRSLRFLFLAGNEIQFIGKKAFSTLYNLKALSLNSNMLKVIPYHAFGLTQQFFKSGTFIIRTNPLVCSCELVWMRRIAIRLSRSETCTDTSANRTFPILSFPINDCQNDTLVLKPREFWTVPRNSGIFTRHAEVPLIFPLALTALSVVRFTANLA